jgi:hypothetical protein
MLIEIVERWQACAFGKPQQKNRNHKRDKWKCIVKDYSFLLKINFQFCFSDLYYLVLIFIIILLLYQGKFLTFTKALTIFLSCICPLVLYYYTNFIYFKFLAKLGVVIVHT